MSKFYKYRKSPSRNGKCPNCPFANDPSVCYVGGSGTYRVPVFVVGEAPGWQENQRGAPFVGRAGKLLRSEISRAGLDPSALYLTNTVKCFPSGTPTPEWAESCADRNLQKEIQERDPTFLLSLGATALRALTGEEYITKMRGKLHPCRYNDGLVFATFHPAYILRSGKTNEALFRDDLKSFARLASLEL